MSYLNSVTPVGFVGADPEQRQAKGNGSKFTVLSLATQHSWKNADDEWSSKTEWHRVVVFRPLLAERVAAAVKKLCLAKTPYTCKMNDLAKKLNSDSSDIILAMIIRRHLHKALKELNYMNPYTGTHKAGNHAFRRFRNTYLRNGPSWLTFLGHMRDSLWSMDLFRCESAMLRTHWVLVVMDQYTRRIIGFGVHGQYFRSMKTAAPPLCRCFVTV